MELKQALQLLVDASSLASLNKQQHVALEGAGNLLSEYINNSEPKKEDKKDKK